MRQILSILVDNRFGELPRIVGFVTGRGFPLESVLAAEAPDGRTMRIQVVTRGDDAAVERLRRLLARQVRVCEAVRVSESPAIEREMALVTVRFDDDAAFDRVRALARQYNARVLDVAAGAAVVEVTGARAAVDALVEALESVASCEVSRTGPLAIARLDQNATEEEELQPNEY